MASTLSQTKSSGEEMRLFGSTVVNGPGFNFNGLNERGEVVFNAELADGTSGIFRACPVVSTVPEPATMLLFFRGSRWPRIQKRLQFVSVAVSSYSPILSRSFVPTSETGIRMAKYWIPAPIGSPRHGKAGKADVKHLFNPGRTDNVEAFFGQLSTDHLDPPPDPRDRVKIAVEAHVGTPMS